MKEQEYNQFVSRVSSFITPLNQLLFEIIVIFAIYIYLERIQSISIYLSRNSISVITILTILAICVDLYIWHRPIQTLLFGAILVIYIRYRISNTQLISNFINITKDYADAAELSHANDASYSECNIPRTTAIHEMIDLPYDTTAIKPFGIMAYDKTETSINSIHDAYKSDNNPPATITDSNYARIMLNELYQTPQYINSHLPNDIPNDIPNATQHTIPNAINSSPANDNFPTKKGMTDKELLDSFRNPKREFLDARWLSKPEVKTYNDNSLCKLGICKATRDTKKDAICNVVQFGKKLEQCTNQDNSVSIDQLEKISNNAISYEDF
jgi:hypothetical protein